MQNYNFQKAHRSILQLAYIHVNRATYYEIRPFQKIKNLWFFWRFFFRNKVCCRFEFAMNQIFVQRFIIFEKLRYSSKLLLKLQAVKVGISLNIA